MTTDEFIRQLQAQEYYALIAGWAQEKGLRADSAVRGPVFMVPTDVLADFASRSGYKH